MGLDATGWTPATAGERIAQVRAEYDAAAGQPLAYQQGTPEAAETVAYGVMSARVEADASVLIDALSPETAAGANLDRIGAFRGIARRQATFSRYIAYPVLGSGYATLTIPAGTVVRDVDRQQWQTVETVTGATAATPIAIEAMTSGAVVLDAGPQTLGLVTPVVGLASLSYDAADADPYEIGRPRQTDAQYRVTLRQALSLGSGASAPGVRTSLLGLSWVQAVDVVRPTAGTVRVYVVPAPVGSDQRGELARAILSTIAFGIATIGDDTETVTVDGVTDTVAWSTGADLPVTVAVALTLAAGVALSDVSATVADAVEALIATLGRGAALRRLQLSATVAPIAGIIGAAWLLDGVDADVVPASTELIVLSGSVVVT
jgi:uncharacterized phage protein gp47/JayE